MEGVRAELGEWGELQQQKGKLEESIYLTRVLLGIVRSTEPLKEVSLPLIVQLFDRLHLWSEMNLKGVYVHPSEKNQKREYSLYTWQSYQLPVLLEFVNEGLKQILVQQCCQA